MPEGNGYVDVVCVDAMKTIFELKDVETIPRLYAKAAGRDFNQSFQTELDHLLRKWRQKWAGEDDDKVSLTIDQYWLEVNTGILGELNPGFTELEKKEHSLMVRKRIIGDSNGDSDLYCVHEDTLQAMEQLSEFCHSRRGLLVFASNQPESILSRMKVANDRLDKAFDNLFTPTKLHSRKPLRGFWTSLRGNAQITKRILAMVGNSLENDLAAVNLPAPVYLLDRDGSREQTLNQVPGFDTPHLRPSVLRRWKEGKLIKVFHEPCGLVDCLIKDLE